jgi:hypothetical protein
MKELSAKFLVFYSIPKIKLDVKFDNIMYDCTELSLFVRSSA